MKNWDCNFWLAFGVFQKIKFTLLLSLNVSHISLFPPRYGCQEHRLRVQIPALYDYMTLDKLANFSTPQLPHLQKNRIMLILMVSLQWGMRCKVLRTLPATQDTLISRQLLLLTSCQNKGSGCLWTVATFQGFRIQSSLAWHFLESSRSSSYKHFSPNPHLLDILNAPRRSPPHSTASVYIQTIFSTEQRIP